MADMRQGGVGLGQALQGAINDAKRRQPQMVLAARNNDAWNKIAEPAALKHTDYVYTVADTDGAKVVVYVDSNIWATELNLQCELLRLKMNMSIADAGYAHGDAEPIKHLRFAASKEKYRGRRACDVPVSQQLLDEGMRFEGDPIPLSDDEEAQIAKQVSCIEDPNLRRAAQEAMRASAELRKGNQE